MSRIGFGSKFNPNYAQNLIGPGSPDEMIQKLAMLQMLAGHDIGSQGLHNANDQLRNNGWGGSVAGKVNYQDQVKQTAQKLQMLGLTPPQIADILKGVSGGNFADGGGIEGLMQHSNGLSQGIGDTPQRPPTPYWTAGKGPEVMGSASMGPEQDGHMGGPASSVLSPTSDYNGNN